MVRTQFNKSIVSILFLVFISVQLCFGTIQNDSIKYYIDKVKNVQSDIQKTSYSKKGFSFLNKMDNDSLRIAYMLKLAFLSRGIQDTLWFQKINTKALTESIKLGNDYLIGDAHWNFAAHFVEREKFKLAYLHYFKAYGSFLNYGHKYYTAKMLFNLAFVEGRLRDYTSSEKHTYEAIEIFENLKKYKNLYLCYNHLGAVYSGLGEFEESIKYYSQARKYLIKSDAGKDEETGLLNNLGVIEYKRNDYEQALLYLNEGLTRIDSTTNVLLKARIIDNIGYTKILSKDTTKVLSDLTTALKIRDSLNSRGGLTISYMHFSKYYALIKDTTNALIWGRKYNFISKEVGNNRDLLDSYLWLSKIDEKNAKDYLGKYVELQNQLIVNDRINRNKLARIQYETDSYIKENKTLKTENTIVYFAGGTLVLFLGLLYVIRVQKSKNRELVLEQDRQKANEEVYQLLLKQQEAHQVGQETERQRLSRELHDGVLGDLYGTRLGIELLSDPVSEEDLVRFTSKLQGLEEEIRVISHDLKNDRFSQQADFSSLLEKLVKDISETGGFEAVFSTNKHIDWTRIGNNLKITLFRVSQELLQNIVKHADAKFVKFLLVENQGLLTLEVADDGVGIGANNTNNGIGLENIQTRIHAINGSFSIEPQEAGGTIATISIQTTN